MSDLISYGGSLLVAVFIYWTDRLLPKWFGGVYCVAFFLLMLYPIITRGHILSMLLVLVVGEAVFGGFWLWAREDKQKKQQKELEKMKARDLSHKND